MILAPWKSATSTVRVRLAPFSEGSYDVFYDLNPVLRRVVHQHMTYADFAALPESRLGYTTAAFVRNPYDRVYSGFLQLQKDLRTQPEMEYPDRAVRRLVLEQLAENRAQLEHASFQFEPWLESVEDHQVLAVGRNTSFPLHPAHYWTHHAGQQAVDFIGRVENFESDFERLCSKLGLLVDSHANANVEAPEDLLVPKDGHGYRYLEHFGAAARRRVNDLFREDFALFGYAMV
ncbi:MAG TPA: sulfotransferase family 2 domain-containing protein [Solirubrobacteraceae bacterium]|nr:sulfotransferase family 2 domain-containing protein [Solirubrobacteraceae bacterium]